MREIALQTKNLTKQYKNFTALDHVDMTVYRGDIYGLIGRNGAGKTTTMKLVTGLSQPSEGEFSMFGQKGRAALGEKRRMGCLIENPAFFGGMTAYQNLKYYALQKGITHLSQIDEALKLVELDRECSRCVEVKTTNTKRGATLLEKKGIQDYKAIDSQRLRIYDLSISSGELNHYFVTEGLDVSEIYETGISIEDYFKSLVKKAV